MQPDHHWNIFNQHIDHLVDFSEEEKTFCKSNFHLHSFPKGIHLLEQGKVCCDLFFIAEGLCRIYFIDKKGDERTIGFMVEDDFCTNYNSFLLQSPSDFYIQTLEPVTAIILPRTAVYEGYRLSKEGEKLGRLLGEKYYIQQTAWIHDIYSKDVLMRYEDIIRRFPSLPQRVPQYMIASYLNITPVHLSRILAKRFINK